MADVDKSIEQLGIAEILTTLCPGGVLLSASLVWLPLAGDSWFSFASRIAHSAAGPFVFVFLAYALGLCINGWAARGFVRFEDLRARRRASSGFKKLWLTLRLIPKLVLHARRPMKSSATDVDARFEIVEAIRSRYGDGIAELLDLNSLFAVFRALVWNKVERHELMALSHGEAQFQRRAFAQGVALAACLMAIQSAVVSAIVWRYMPERRWDFEPLLIGVTLAAFSGSLLLRGVATRLHSDERVFAYAVLHSWKAASEEHTRQGVLSE